MSVRPLMEQGEAFGRGKEIPAAEKADLARSQILADLPSEETRRLLANMEIVRVHTNDILAEGGVPITHCYFPLDAVVTLVANLEEGSTVEVGLIGNEGLIGIRVILGRSTGAYLAVVQIPGNCLRIKSDLLRTEFKRGGVLQDRLLQYVRYMLAQVSQTAACNRMHLLEQRLSRWLLSIQDRVKSDELILTHEAVATRVGRSRTAVTNTLRLLQLPPSVQRHVRDGALSMGHARALLGTPDRALQERLAGQAVREGWSVRAVEEAVRGPATSSGRSRAGVDPSGATKALRPPGLAELEGLLGDHLETRVAITMGAKRGKITVEFSDLEDLERIYKAIAG